MLDSYNEVRNVIYFSEVLDNYKMGFINQNLCCVPGYLRDGKNFLLSFMKGKKWEQYEASKKGVKAKRLYTRKSTIIYETNYHKAVL